jgi:NDP-sugar pyrophosphorylase family protein
MIVTKNEKPLNARFVSVVLSGGKGTRLESNRKTITAKLYPQLSQFWQQEGPKGLATLCINGKTAPLLDYHLQLHAQSQVIDKIYLALGFGSAMIVNYYSNCNFSGIPLEFIYEKKPAGTLAALAKLHQQGLLTDQPLLLSNGDNLLIADIMTAYDEGLRYAQKLNLNTEHLIINLTTLVPLSQSAAFGVLDVTLNPLTEKCGIVQHFYEKQAIELNPYIIKDNEKWVFINSGYSFIINPKALMDAVMTPELAKLMLALENDELEYKTHEKAVRYETMFAKMAEEQCVIAVYCDGFWADSGSDAQFCWIESHYPCEKK